MKRTCKAGLEERWAEPEVALCLWHSLVREHLPYICRWHSVGGSFFPTTNWYLQFPCRHLSRSMSHCEWILTAAALHRGADEISRKEDQGANHSYLLAVSSLATSNRITEKNKEITYKKGKWLNTAGLAYGKKSSPKCYYGNSFWPKGIAFLIHFLSWLLSLILKFSVQFLVD